MKTFHRLTQEAWFKLCCLLIATASLWACKNEGESLSLGPLPVPDFEAVIGDDGNTVQLINKTNVPAIAYWTIESTNQKLQGETVSTSFTFQGTYDVTLTAAGQGGMASVTKPVTIAQNDPAACNPDKALGFIAGCIQKTWKLNPEAGAYKVGDAGPDEGNWWSSGDGEVTARACEFNDEYTFVFDAAGTFIYDNKGDFYADGYLGNGTHGCEPNSNLSSAQQPWGSGEFSFSVSEGNGVRGLGQLTVRGVGAHIGLQKVHNGGETTGAPTWGSVTYDILEMTQNVGGQGYDILKVGVNIGGNGWWTFALRADSN